MIVQVQITVDEKILSQYEGFDSIKDFRNNFNGKAKNAYSSADGKEVTLKDVVEGLIAEELVDVEYFEVGEVTVINDKENKIKK